MTRQEGILFCLVGCLIAAQANSARANQTGKPHILMMLVDDWGWANVGFHRPVTTPEINTPNIDALVARGLRLDRHYTYTFCSPTRSSLMSGRYPIHVNDKNLDPTFHNPDDPVSGFAAIPRNMTGIAEKMRSGGYRTHQVGKWDAGMATWDHTPEGRGFETSFGYFHHDNDYYNELALNDKSCNQTITDLWDTNRPAHGINGTDYEEFLFKDRVLDIIDKHNASEPLFLYYAPHLVHSPLEVPQVYLDRFMFIDDDVRRRYHAMVNCLDDVFGNVTKALKDKGMWDDLLWVTSSDNGGPIYGGGGANNWPLRGAKFAEFDGGYRVNAFVSGGYLPESQHGNVTEGYIHVSDWYATFCALARVDATDEKAAAAGLPPVDGMNVWPLISGINSTSPRVDLPLSVQTLISGRYKIVTGKSQYSVWTGPQYPNTTSGPVKDVIHDCGDSGCLFDIYMDPTEHNNINETMPDIQNDMLVKLQAYQATYFNPDRGVQDPKACDVAFNENGGFWGPFLE